MFQYSTLHQLYSIYFTYQRVYLYIKTGLIFFKRFPTKHIMSPLFFIILTFVFAPAYSQENYPQTLTVDTKVANIFERNILNKAKALRHNAPKKSTKLANKALILSKENNNHRISAQAHSFLGKLAQESKKIDQSLHHFLQASLLYKKMNDKQNQIMSTIDYAKLFFAEKRYLEGEKVIDELLPFAQQYGSQLRVAIILTIKGNGYYQRKQYNDAIMQYTHALKYLSDNDQTIQKQRGKTYTKIAESYKRVKERKLTASFYKKALDIFTVLQDRKYIARTLNTLAEAERYLENYVMALDYSIRGLEIHNQLDDPVGRAKALMGAGIIYRHLNSYEKSLKHIHEAHLYYQKVNDAGGIAISSNQIGLIYTRLKQFDQAKSFYQLTIDLPENKIRQKTLASALREMAVIYLNSADYDLAKAMAQKAYKIYKIKNDKSKASVTTRIIANIYRAEHNDTKAIAYYRESLSLANQIGSKLYKIKAQTALAGILIGKDTDKAIILLKKSLELSTQINTKSQKLYAYRLLLQAEKSRGNIAESLRYAEEEIALTLIIQNEREENELVLAKANLHSYKMEIELESLREKTKLDQLELVKKNNDIEIVGQARMISELELTKNRYASFALASLLIVCLIVVVFIYRRFIDSKKRNEELDYLAARDPLTNCYNRRILFDLMNRDFSDIELLGEYCIIMADIDHFKAVNDTHGHCAGDSVLRGVANIMQGCVRQNDIVARFGGEEFCIVLHRASQNQAMRIAETIRQKIEANRVDDINLTCSFGVASIQFNAQAPTELIDQADLALYKSKTNGRNQVTLWDQALKEK